MPSTKDLIRAQESLGNSIHQLIYSLPYCFQNPLLNVKESGFHLSQSILAKAALPKTRKWIPEFIEKTEFLLPGNEELRPKGNLRLAVGDYSNLSGYCEHLNFKRRKKS
jgi:hypothetical protein